MLIHLSLSRGGVKLNLEPEILYPWKKDTVSRFVKKAIKEGSHLIKPTLPGLSPEGWIRGKNILGSYLISNAEQAKVGQVYKVPQSSIYSSIRRSIEYLWLNSSPELKEQFLLPYKPAVLPSERKPIHPKLREALSGVQFTFIDPISRDFLKQAFAEGAHLTTPPGMNSERWANYRNIFGTYILSHATLGQVGKIYGISRERVRQINEIVLKKLFPENKISIKKEVKYLPKEWLLVKDNLGTEIVEFLEQGLSTDQILSCFDTRSSRTEAIKVLRMLREMDFDIKRIKKSHGEYLRIQQELLKEDLSDGQIQSLLDQINSMQGIQFLLPTRKAVIPIRDVLLSVGFHYRINKAEVFYDALIDAGIPFGMAENIVQTGPQKGRRWYYFIAAQHRQRAEKALQTNPDLVKFLENPVKQINGPKTKIPTTTEIMGRRGVLSFASILSEFGIGRSKKSIEIKLALEASNETPMFTYSQTQGFYILEADLQKVRSFIKDHLGLPDN